MAFFELAVLKTLAHEGGFVNDPADPGGATNFGITQADMPGQDMKTLAQAQAITYYQQHYWKQNFSQITDQAVAEKIFDSGVLFGVGEAVKLLQEVMQIAVDGAFGPETLQHVNSKQPAALLTAYKARLVTHALGVGAVKPQLRKFVGGWIARVNS